MLHAVLSWKRRKQKHWEHNAATATRVLSPLAAKTTDVNCAWYFAGAIPGCGDAILNAIMKPSSVAKKQWPDFVQVNVGPDVQIAAAAKANHYSI